MHRVTRPVSPPPAGILASTALAPSAAWRAAIRRGCPRCSPRTRTRWSWRRSFHQLVAVIEQERPGLGTDPAERGNDRLRVLAGHQDRFRLHDIGVVADEVLVLPEIDEAG